jgi:S1-C subfamily serine protease
MRVQRTLAGVVSVLAFLAEAEWVTPSALGEEGPTVADACVLVRPAAGGAEAAAPGSASAGFFISPTGHILTTYGAVSGRVAEPPASGTNGKDATGLSVEVLWAVAGEEGGLRPLEASVLAASPQLNLAVVTTETAVEVPFVRLGDSDALERAQPVTALGHPRAGRTRDGRLAVWPPEVQPGRVRAFPGDRRATGGSLIETEAAQRIGVGGGPLVGEDGYVVGIVQKGNGPDGAGGGIPINIAREFLEAKGLSMLLPQRLSLSAREQYDPKGLRLPVAGAVRDRWLGRTRWESDPDSSGLALRIDRVFSSLGLGELEARLLSGQEFGGFPAQRQGDAGGGARDIPPLRARVFGSATGWVGDSLYGIEYAIFNAEAERLVARYSGPADLLAYNRSVLRRSLREIQITRLLTRPITAPLPVVLEALRLPASDAPVVRLPVGWVRGPVAEFVPAGLPPPDAALTASPREDFTIAARVLWWRRAPSTAEEAAAVAGSTPGAFGPPSYRAHETLLGVPWLAVGRFLAIGDSLLLLEIRTPRDKALFLDDLHDQWLAAGLS